MVGIGYPGAAGRVSAGATDTVRMLDQQWSQTGDRRKQGCRHTRGTRSNDDHVERLTIRDFGQLIGDHGCNPMDLASVHIEPVERSFNTSWHRIQSRLWQRKHGTVVLRIRPAKPT